MIDHYDWAGGTEAMLRFVPATGPVVVLALPPLEEANRTRTLMVAVLRQLGDAGIGGALPDLPGQGESLVETEAATLADWRAAFAAAVATLPRPRFALSIRAGALVDTQAGVEARWSLSPQSGPELLRELRRIERAAGGEADGTVAGNRIGARLLEELAGADTGAIDRTLRLGDDAHAADRRLPFPPPWRRAEPDADPALAQVLGDDIVHWVRTWPGA